jgi:hypothetical protein
MYFRKDVFKDTDVWDSDDGQSLKAGYTFRDLYKAIDAKAAYRCYLGSKTPRSLGPSAMPGTSPALSSPSAATTTSLMMTKALRPHAKCWFSYDADVDAAGTTCINGLNASYGMLNTITDAPTSGRKGTKGSISHFMFSDGDKQPLNDNISKYASKDATKNATALRSSPPSAEPGKPRKSKASGAMTMPRPIFRNSNAMMAIISGRTSAASS